MLRSGAGRGIWGGGGGGSPGGFDAGTGGRDVMLEAILDEKSGRRQSFMLLSCHQTMSTGETKTHGADLMGVIGGSARARDCSSKRPGRLCCSGRQT